MDHALAPLSPNPSVGLILLYGVSSAGWAIIVSAADGARAAITVETQYEHQKHRRQPTIDAVDNALALATGTGAPVDLLVYGKVQTKPLRRQTVDDDQLRVLTGAHLNFEHPTVVAVRAELRARLVAADDEILRIRPLKVKAAVNAPRVPVVGADWAVANKGVSVTVATDGSFHPGRGGAAFAWVVNDQLYAYGPCPSASALGAELDAINHALTTLKRQRVTVHTDSQLAIAAVAPGGGSSLSPAERVLAAAVRSRIAQSPGTTLVWVRSHSGPGLNDVADRLARLARQSTAFETEAGTRDGIAATIAKDAQTPCTPV